MNKQTKTYKMKINIIFFLLLFLCYGCSEDNDNQKSATIDLNEIYKSLDLKNPDIILNEIAIGEIQPLRISNILSVNNVNVPPFRYYFEYLPNTNKISKLFTYNNNQCREEISTIFYNSSNFISKVETLTKDFCQQNEFTTIYNFNYSEGVLKSVISNNTSFIYEKYFSYYPNGKISTIYSVGKPKSDPSPTRQFIKSYFTYDLNGNVKTMENDQTDLYNIKTTYEYDNKTNPLKGFFINNIFGRPIQMAGILSENNIIATKDEYTNFPNIPPINNYIQYNYMNNNVINFSYGVNSTYFINYE